MALALLWSAGAVAEAPNGQVSTLNMPPGWQWPPSAAMQDSRMRCLAALDAAGVEYAPVNQPLGKVAAPVVVPAMQFAGLSVRLGHTHRPPLMDCHMALSLAQHAPLLAELGIRELVVTGFYQNRRARLGGRRIGLLSRHALGLAVDITALVLDDGTTVSVQHDYAHPVFAKLEEALVKHGQLRAVVTPRNDQGHRDHLHWSAKMTIDPQSPDPSIEVADLLQQLQATAPTTSEVPGANPGPPGPQGTVASTEGATPSQEPHKVQAAGHAASAAKTMTAHAGVYSEDEMQRSLGPSCAAAPAPIADQVGYYSESGCILRNFPNMTSPPNSLRCLQRF